jgi:TolA-binding protein
MASSAESIPQTGEATEGNSDFLERLKAHRKVLTGAGIAVALIILVAWFTVESGRRREMAATGLLEGAWALQDQGELPQASAEFQRVIDGFSGTDAAMQAVLALNQVRLNSDQAQIAADALTQFIATSPPAAFASAAHRLLGVAQENLGAPAEAAAAYERAATLATSNPLKATALLDAARAFRSSGNTDEAVRVLRIILAEHAGSAVEGEARVRLAEVTQGGM